MKRSSLIADQDFYILKFKDEPIIKIGRTTDIYQRIEYITRGYRGGYFVDKIFDYNRCYLIEATYNYCITDLETEVKKEFQDYRCQPSPPWTLGNGERMPKGGMFYTEIFQSFITRNILDLTDRLMKKWGKVYYIRTASVHFDYWEYWNKYGVPYWDWFAPEIPLIAKR